MLAISAANVAERDAVCPAHTVSSASLAAFVIALTADEAGRIGNVATNGASSTAAPAIATSTTTNEAAAVSQTGLAGVPQANGNGSAVIGGKAETVAMAAIIQAV